jgi:N-acetylglucosamine-6-phosphate deacetylase
MSSFVPAPGDAGPAFALVGRVLDRGGASTPGAVIVAGGRVAAVETDADDPRLPPHRWHAAYVAAGFVDLQVNGGFGHEVGGDPAALRALAAKLPSTGVTAFLPTLVSGAAEAYAASLATIDEVRLEGARGDAPASARILGVHLEGPLLSTARAGAHARSAIEAATPSLVDGLADPARVRLVTLAPERPGALELIRRLRARGITVSLGHTDASFQAFTSGVDAGATVATHLWNAMSPFHHRAPGAAGAALFDDRVVALAIADGIHVHPAAFAVALRAKGLDRLALVTDAIAGAGLGPGPSTLAGQAVTIDETGARLSDGTLAGSTLALDQAVRNAARFAELSPAEAVHLASTVPARVLGLAAASSPLRPGSAADLVLLDEQLIVQATFVGGHLAFLRDGAAGMLGS